MYCLWLNGKKTGNLVQLRENYHLQSLCNYLLGGSLAGWLEQAGAPELAQRVRKIDLNGDYESELAEILGEKSQLPPFVPDYSPVPEANGQAVRGAGSLQDIPDSFSGFFSGEFALNSSYGYGTSGYSAVSSGLYGSFTSGSSGVGLGIGVGVGAGGSFAKGSFYGYSGSFFFGYLGSLGFLGSLGSGFAFGSRLGFLGSFGENYPVSFSGFSSFSFEEFQKLSPHKKIMINLSSDPMNRYGYGMHII